MPPSLWLYRFRAYTSLMADVQISQDTATSTLLPLIIQISASFTSSSFILLMLSASTAKTSETTPTATAHPDGSRRPVSSTQGKRSAKRQNRHGPSGTMSATTNLRILVKHWKRVKRALTMCLRTRERRRGGRGCGMRGCGRMRMRRIIMRVRIVHLQRLSLLRIELSFARIFCI